MQTKPRLLVCIYTCNTDDHLLNEFYSSTVIDTLKKRCNTSLIEVRADDSLERDTFFNSHLTLKTIEHYNNLPQKTFCMIRYLFNNLEFDYLLKMDVTTLTTVIRNELMTGGKKVSELELLECINNSNFYSDYNGYVQLSAKRKGAENWANIKNIDIDFDKVFDADETPPFYSGKLWLINREFASFVVNNGETVVNKFSKYFPAEDVMLGTLYQHFKYKNNLKNKFLRLFKRH